jgi:hypothetical protein
MALTELTAAEWGIVGECLQCVASGEVIFDDWEFETLFGMTFAEVKRVAAQWPDVDASDLNVCAAITNSMGHLVGYPHGGGARWSRYISVPPAEVLRVLNKWRERNQPTLE